MGEGRTSGRELPPMMTARAPIAICLSALLSTAASAQCPQLYDYWGTPSDTPSWYSCSGSNFTLLIRFAHGHRRLHHQLGRWLPRAERCRAHSADEREPRVLRDGRILHGDVH